MLSAPEGCDGLRGDYRAVGRLGGFELIGVEREAGPQIVLPLQPVPGAGKQAV